MMTSILRTKPTVVFAVAALVVCGLALPSNAEQMFRFRNGLVIRGTMGEIATLKDGFGAAAAGQINVRPIWMINDGLRRTFVHGQGMVAGNPIQVNDLEQSIEIYQPVPLAGKVVSSLGSILSYSRYNHLGRRSITLRSSDGPFHLYQGITLLNSRYAKVEALKGKPSLDWDMRVATSSFDSATLKMILGYMVDEKDLDGRLEVVRFFISAERYDDAWQLLSDVIKDFPEAEDLRPQLAALTERQAAQLLEEAETRSKAGQTLLAREMLNQFPRDVVGRVTRLKVDDALAALDNSEKQASQMVSKLREQIGQLDERWRDALAAIVNEMDDGLSQATLARLSDYSQFADSDTLPVDNKVALAVAGWLLGSGSGEQNLTVVVSLIRVRDLVAEYLGTSDVLRRQAILDELRNLEGAEPEYVDRMLPLLRPPLALPAEAESESFPGMYDISVGDFRYVIQLPPQYDPLREYPCIIALHESTGTPESQIDWWAGSTYSKKLKSRVGHAARFGFVVVAPVWTRSGQRMYEYTPQEHQRVLVCMRDAMRRTSIDSDRVFVGGHGEGGTAAWDIALAHPDLWAGMISLSGAPSIKRVVPHYKANSEYVPLYMVMGDRDSDKVTGSIIDDYMTFQHDAMVVMYKGRGRGYFPDELPRIFEWMRLTSHARRETPREFEVATMRLGDQLFWWVELMDLKPDVPVDPILWDKEKKRIRAVPVTGSIGEGNQIRVRGPSDRIKLLLRPQPYLDLNERITVRHGSRVIPLEFDGTLDVMLEDARRRADRKRPVWMESLIR